MTRDDLPLVQTGRFVTTPLFDALEVARLFGQEPIEFVRRFERMARGEKAILSEFAKIKAETAVT